MADDKALIRAVQIARMHLRDMKNHATIDEQEQSAEATDENRECLEREIERILEEIEELEKELEKLVRLRKLSGVSDQQRNVVMRLQYDTQELSKFFHSRNEIARKLRDLRVMLEEIRTVLRNVSEN